MELCDLLGEINMTNNKASVCSLSSKPIARFINTLRELENPHESEYLSEWHLATESCSKLYNVNRY